MVLEGREVEERRGPVRGRPAGEVGGEVGGELAASTAICIMRVKVGGE
jgi:hypothetical protein